MNRKILQKPPRKYDMRYNTILTPEQEKIYQQWVNSLPINLRGDYDYDLRGAWLNGDQPDEYYHMPDTWKKPWHPTFSNESIYSTPGAEGGRWDGEEFHPSRLNRTLQSFKFGEWGGNTFAKGGKKPDWDPENPYHVHTEDGQKVSFTPEAYAALPEYLKQQVDQHYNEMNTFENQYMVNPEYEEFRKRMEAARMAENVAASRGEYWDRNWYDPNYKSGAYAFDDNGLMTYQGQTYAPFGDSSQQGIVVPMRTPHGVSYGANVVYYPITVPQQWIEKPVEAIDDVIGEQQVNFALNNAYAKYIQDNTKLQYGINPHWITTGWETSFGHGEGLTPKRTYEMYYGDWSDKNQKVMMQWDYPSMTNKNGWDVIRRMYNSGKPMYYYMRHPNPGTNAGSYKTNQYLPDIYVDLDTAKSIRDAYKQRTITETENDYNEFKEQVKKGYWDNQKHKAENVNKWYLNRLNSLKNNTGEDVVIYPIKTKPTEEEARQNARISIGELQYLGQNEYANGGANNFAKGGPDGPPERVNLDMLWNNNVSVGNNRKMNRENMEMIDNYFISKGVPLYQRQALLYTILQESGGDTLGAHGNGYYGLVGWSPDRYNVINDKSLMGQVEHLYNTLYNGDGAADWNHGGTGSGYNSWTDARDAFTNASDFNTALRALNYGYVRPAPDVLKYRLQNGSKHFESQEPLFHPGGEPGFRQGAGAGASFSDGGSIHIKPENRGKFTAAAKRVGKSVQEYASQILANKDHYSSTLVKRANFARNAKKFH